MWNRGTYDLFQVSMPSDRRMFFADLKPIQSPSKPPELAMYAVFVIFSSFMNRFAYGSWYKIWLTTLLWFWIWRRRKKLRFFLNLLICLCPTNPSHLTRQLHCKVPGGPCSSLRPKNLPIYFFLRNRCSTVLSRVLSDSIRTEEA